MPRVLGLVGLAMAVAVALAWTGALDLRRPAGAGLAGSYANHNVLVISVDTLRADRLGAYGYPRPTSPTIDRLAGRGITFDLAMAPRGATWPSLATMLTSRSPADHGVRENGQYLSEDAVTLAGVLRDRGYHTGAFVSGSVCHMTRRLAGFETVACGEDDFVTERAVAFLEDTDDNLSDGRPFFAWHHVIAPHGPYDPPAEHDRFTDAGYQGPVGRTQEKLATLIRSQRALSEADRAQLDGLYDGEVLYADALVARVLDALERKGLASRTIVVFTADHGEDLHQHFRYLYHSCSVYDTTLHIPLIVALPDAAEAARRVPSVVEMEDLAPTVLELTGLAAPEPFEGESLLARIGAVPVDLPSARAGVALSEWYDVDTQASIETVRTRRWRYVSNPEGHLPRCPPKANYYKVEREGLYDHQTDSLEQNNVVAEHPEIARHLAAVTEAMRRRSQGFEPVPVDKALEEELRSFGYIE